MTYISPIIRRQVTERAKERCEYCLFPQYATLFTFEMEHIIAEKHGGVTSFHLVMRLKQISVDLRY